MKKTISIIIVAFIFLAQLTGCQSSVTNAEQQSSNNQNLQKTLEISAEKSAGNLSEGFNIVKKYLFEQQDKTINFTVLTNAEVDSDGKTLLDDSQDWALTAETGEKQFSLIKPKTLQLGAISVEAYTDESDKTIHLLATVKDSGSLKIYDYYYNEEKDCFVSNEVYSKENIKLEYSQN